MKNDYSARQSKTYEDYNIYPSEQLKEMLESNKYIPSVNDIIRDILIERKISINNGIDNKHLEKSKTELKKNTLFKNLPEKDKEFIKKDILSSINFDFDNETIIFGIKTKYPSLSEKEISKVIQKQRLEKYLAWAILAIVAVISVILGKMLELL